MLIKKTDGVAYRPRLSKALAGLTGSAIDRRTFLKRSGMTVGGLAAASALSLGNVKKAAAQAKGSSAVKQVKSICTHCAVGCTVIAEVQNGVWVGQEPGYDSPINMGAHCAKGAAVREHAHGERRLKYPMKLAGGKWQRMKWDDAINEIGDRLLKIRKDSGPDSVYGWGQRNTATSKPICSVNSMRSGAPIMVITRLVFVTQRRLRVLQTPGATGR